MWRARGACQARPASRLKCAECVCVRACACRPRRGRDPDARGPAGSCSAAAEPQRRGGARCVMRASGGPPRGRRARGSKVECMDGRAGRGVQDARAGAVCHSGSAAGRDVSGCAPVLLLLGQGARALCQPALTTTPTLAGTAQVSPSGLSPGKRRCGRHRGRWGRKLEQLQRPWSTATADVCGACVGVSCACLRL